MHLGNASFHLVRNHLPNTLLSKNLKIKINTSIALHVVLSGCVTCLTSREDHRLRVFEIRVLGMISGAKRER
jgi:hypothetical protein